MIYLQYDSATGAVKALLRPSTTAASRRSWTLPHYEEHAKGQPLADGADAVLVLEDEADLPIEATGKPFPIHLLHIAKEGAVYVKDEMRAGTRVSIG